MHVLESLNGFPASLKCELFSKLAQKRVQKLTTINDRGVFVCFFTLSYMCLFCHVGNFMKLLL